MKSQSIKKLFQISNSILSLKLIKQHKYKSNNLKVILLKIERIEKKVNIQIRNR